MDGMCLRERALLFATLVALAGGVGAQGVVSEVGERLRFERWNERWLEPGTGLLGEGTVWPEIEGALLKPRDAGDDLAEELAARIAVEPPPVSRATLEGTGERSQRFRALPGGIVLGVSASVDPALTGARIERHGPALALRLADGREARWPALARESLRACVEFASQRLDGLVDLSVGLGDAPRLAPAFAGGELGARLVLMDALPHRLLPETRPWKSVIVDRAVRVELREDTLAFAAELEVRFYDDGAGSGWARRVCRLDVPGPDFVGPRATPDLGRELAPLAEVAGWLGFLRWIAGVDPAGFDALRAELAHSAG
jgi:hypothetical protein